MGGMAAFIPSRKDEVLNEIALKKVREDKEREAKEGFDGTWVAHPDLVPTAMDVFNSFLKDEPHQKNNLKAKINITSKELLSFNIPNSSVTEAGIRQNINVPLLYIESWLNGVGAAALYNLMEDTATAEISRAQLWHWLHHSQPIVGGPGILTLDYFQALCNEEYKKISASFTPEKSLAKLSEAKLLLEKLVLSDHFEDFLTLPAYEMIP
jgi:malate synthase